MMNLSAHGAADLLISEAIVTSRYKDSVGVWTIGVGHTKAAGGVNPALVSRNLTVDECLDIFLGDVPKYVADVNRAVKVPVTQYEFDAMLSFHFNTGSIARATFVKQLNAGASRAAVAAGFMAWSRPPEIVGRRTREMNLFRTGQYVKSPRAPIYPASAAGNVLWGKRTQMNVLPILEKMFPKVLPGPTPNERPILRIGARGPSVLEWQGILGGPIQDGKFGPLTEAATKAWQKARGLVDDGVVGSKTWAAALGQSS